MVLISVLALKMTEYLMFEVNIYKCDVQTDGNGMAWF